MSAFTYDALNRQIAASYADGTGTSFAYDGVGRLVRMDDSMGGTLTNTYDVLDRLLAQSTTLGSVGYQYDVLGRRTQLTIPGTAPTTYAYDAASRLTQIVQGAQIVDVQYDDAGRRTLLTLPNGVSTEYQYDLASRLTALTYRNAAVVLGNLTYQYDPAGNRARVGGSFARTLLPTPIASATYDAANRQRLFGDQSMTFDANGNLMTLTDATQTTSLTWDARDRLTSVEQPGTLASFAYAFGRRLAKTVNGAATQFLYDGIDVAQQVEAQRTTGYLRSLAVDETLGLINPDGAFFLSADVLGSTVAVRDASGIAVTEYTYDTFGAVSATNPAFPNPFQFTGRDNDGLPSLYYYRARYYHPGLQRFISEDPLELAGGDANLYAYVENSPVGFTDPLGLLKFSSFGSFQLRAVATPAVLCCGVQGNLGYRLGTTQASPSAVQFQGYANIQVLRGLGVSAGRGAQLGFAFADVEELPQLREVALDTPRFGVSFLFRKGGFPIPVGAAIGGSSLGASLTASHPDWPGKERTLLDYKFDWRDVVGSIWGAPGAGNAVLLGRRK